MKRITINPTAFNDEPDYFPLYNGLRNSSMGLLKFSKSSSRHFIIGPSFNVFRANKEQCRLDGLSKYYQKTNADYPNIIKFIVKTLVSEYPEHFELKHTNGLAYLKCDLTDELIVMNNDAELVDSDTKLKTPFVDAFDALSMQVSEDIVIHDVGNKNNDFAAAIHLMHCNGWETTENIGKSFSFIHSGVPRIQSIVPNVGMMMVHIASSIAGFERIAAISFKTTNQLTLHPAERKKWDKPLNPLKPQMSIRVERQTVTGIDNAFLFTIRTFLYDMATKDPKRHDEIVKVFRDPNPKAYAHDVIMKNQKAVLKWLKKQ